MGDYVERLARLQKFEANLEGYHILQSLSVDARHIWVIFHLDWRFVPGFVYPNVMEMLCPSQLGKQQEVPDGFQRPLGS
jgi:hypothetical protein